MDMQYFTVILVTAIAVILGLGIVRAIVVAGLHREMMPSTSERLWPQFGSALVHLVVLMCWVFIFGYASQDWSSLNRFTFTATIAMLVILPVGIAWWTARATRQYVIARRRNTADA